MGVSVDQAGDDRAAAEIDPARVALCRQVVADAGKAPVPDPHLGDNARGCVHRVESAVHQVEVGSLWRSRLPCLRVQPRTAQPERRSHC